MALDVEMAHGGQGLHALAQAHLIAEHHPLLAERELRAERLVAAQGRAHEREVERVPVDPPRYVGRDEPLAGLDVGCELTDLDEQPVVEDGAFLIVPPQAGRVGRLGGQGRENRLEPGVQARLMHGSHQGFELSQGAPGFLALAAAGKEYFRRLAARPASVRTPSSSVARWLTFSLSGETAWRATPYA